jgi:glutamine amidotransferase
VSVFVTVVDYGSGNLFSVARAIESAGGIAVFANTAEDITRAERILLPGVGAFEEGMKGLRERELIEPLQLYAQSGGLLLGICLGMQMLASTSEEFGEHSGLNIIPGRVMPLPKRDTNGKPLRVPHIGWAELLPAPSARREGSFISEVLTESSVYLVHSYQMLTKCPKHQLAICQYGGYDITAAVRRNNVVGLQFHPEKSGPAGIEILRAFLRL